MVVEGTKATEVDEAIIARSVVEPQPSARNGYAPPGPIGVNGLLFLLGSAAEGMTPWGINQKVRDAELRAFVATEPTFASALGIIVSRNTAFSWKLTGPEATVTRLSRALETSNFGRGWIDLWAKVSFDLYTQDAGGVIEIVRGADSPFSEMVSLNHLDAMRCFHTGIPEAPVVYQDIVGKYHLLKWYQVGTFADMPTPIEIAYGMQVCALSRFLRYAQVLKNIGIYDDEKTGGRHQRAIHLIKGITTKQLEEAIAQANVRLDSRGFTRFAPPILAGSIDPNADVGHDTIELAGLPDNFDRDSQMKWYVAFLAMAFMEDYQTFAPLPGGGLGTSNQSQMLNAKARGKGPGLYQAMVRHFMNMRVLPSNVDFEWDEQDLEADQLQATVRQLRASERAARISSGEITPVIAQNRALNDGDLTQEEYDALQAIDLTPDATVEGGSDPKAQLGSGEDNQLALRVRAQVQREQDEKKQQTDMKREEMSLRFSAQKGQRDTEEGDKDLDDDRLAVEEAFANELQRPFARLRKRFVEVLKGDDSG